MSINQRGPLLPHVMWLVYLGKLVYESERLHRTDLETTTAVAYKIGCGSARVSRHCAPEVT